MAVAVIGEWWQWQSLESDGSDSHWRVMAVAGSGSHWTPLSPLPQGRRGRSLGSNGRHDHWEVVVGAIIGKWWPVWQWWQWWSLERGGRGDHWEVVAGVIIGKWWQGGHWKVVAGLALGTGANDGKGGQTGCSSYRPALRLDSSSPSSDTSCWDKTTVRHSVYARRYSKSSSYPSSSYPRFEISQKNLVPLIRAIFFIWVLDLV